MAAILCRRLCLSTSVSLRFVLQVRNKLVQNFLGDEEECFLYDVLELSLSVR